MASRRRLSFAVFLLFGTVGLLMILMQSSLETLPWKFIIVQTICCGGIAASLVLLGRTRWWITLLVIIFWTGVLLLNSGEFSVGYYDNEGFRVRLGELEKKDFSRHTTTAITLQPEQLNSIYTQKAQLGLCAVAMFVFGYISFIKVLRVEIGHRARLETEVKIARDIKPHGAVFPVLQFPRRKSAAIILMLYSCPGALSLLPLLMLQATASGRGFYPR
jgi:hypothetical protein